MSTSITANDLGSMGAPSSDAALAPLISALTSNTTALGGSTTKLNAVETALEKLQSAFSIVAALSTGINALRVSVERLTATLSSKSSGGVKRGRNLVPAEGSSGMPVKAMPPGSMQSDHNPSVVFIEKAAKKRESEEEKAIRIETEANLRNADELAKLEEKWLKREYDDRKKYQKKKQQEEDRKIQYQPTQEAHVEAYKRDRELKESITKGIAEGAKKYQKEKFEKGMAYGPSRIDYLVGKEKEKEAQSKPKQEAHVEAYKEATRKQDEVDKQAKEKQKKDKELADLERKWIKREYDDRLAWNRKQKKELKKLEEKWLNREFSDRRKAAEKKIKSSKDQNDELGEKIGNMLEGIFKAGRSFIILGKKIGEAIGSIFGKGGPGGGKGPENKGPSGPGGPGGLGGGGGGGGKGKGGSIFMNIGSAIASIIGPIGKIFSVVGTIVGGVIGVFNRLRRAASSLADSAATYAPGIANALRYTLRDLDATIGVFSAHVASASIPLVRGIADTFYPIMKEAGAFFGGIINALTPAINKLLATLLGIKKPGSTIGLAAANNARLTSASAIGETVAQNAFLATSGGIDPQNEFAKQMLENDIPNKWAKMLDANGNVVPNPNFRMNDGGGANPVNAANVNPAQNNALVLKMGN